MQSCPENKGGVSEVKMGQVTQTHIFWGNAFPINRNSGQWQLFYGSDKNLTDGSTDG